MQVQLQNKVIDHMSNSKKALNRALRHVILPGTYCNIHSINSSQREQVEFYVKNKFKQAYDADVKEFMPNLMSIECLKGISASAGFRGAKDDFLFVENYLKKPIEQVLSGIVHQPVYRDDIVEIGNLASTQRGASQLMFILLLAVLHRANFRWVVFTATQQVEQLVNKLRFKPFTICKANLSKLREKHDHSNSHWGSYYDTNPLVLAGDLDSAMNQAINNPIMSSVLEHYEDTIQQICSQIQADQ